MDIFMYMFSWWIWICSICVVIQNWTWCWPQTTQTPSTTIQTPITISRTEEPPLATPQLPAPSRSPPLPTIMSKTNNAWCENKTNTCRWLMWYESWSGFYPPMQKYLTTPKRPSKNVCRSTLASSLARRTNDANGSNARRWLQRMSFGLWGS